MKQKTKWLEKEDERENKEYFLNSHMSQIKC